jgi:hypothetical protein
MAKVKINYDQQNEWYDNPSGTSNQMNEAFEVASEYMYHLLDYADKKVPISDEELERERRIFSFCKLGPRAGYLRLDPNSKLVSADVLYMLTSTLPAKYIAAKFGMCERKVRAIRRGETEEWYWEYLLIRRLKTIITTNLRSAKKGVTAKMYSLSKLVGVNKYEILMYASGKHKLTRLREDIIPIKEYVSLIETKTLDIIYPINQIDLL